MEKYDLIIIGAGPAGLSAGIYASRSGLKTLILEKFDVGGQAVLTERVENYPGTNCVNSRDLIKAMKDQALGFGVKIENDEVAAIQGSSGEFKIKAAKDFFAKTVIIATGASAKKLGFPSEEKFIGRGVSYCATCDGPLFKNKKVCVIGGGNAAVEEAMFLTKFASQVFLVHRRSELRADKILQEELLKNKKVKVIWETVPVEILGDKIVNSIKLKNVKANNEEKLTVDGVFVFIGYVPNTQGFKGLIDLDEEGFIITDEEMKTSEIGIFACGDCRKKPLRQIVTACSDGAVAASSAGKFLRTENS